MPSPRKIIFGVTIALSVLAVAIPGVPGQNPANPKGVDVYAGTGTINWTSVKNAGYSFAFLKATEGTYYQDANYATNRANANAQGIVIGAYHFAEPGTTPSVSANAIAQANYFVNFAKPAKGDIQMVCDWETATGLSAANMGAWLTAFCGQIQTLTHTPAVIYCSPSFWSDNMPSNWTNPNCALWIANWGVTSPTIPAPWASTGYAFWQYSSTTTVPGLSAAHQDVDTFNGPMSTLLKFTYPRDPMAGRR